MRASESVQREETAFRIRPRFRRLSDLSPDEIEHRLRASLDAVASVRGSVHPGHATIKIPREERHYWSPQLQLSFESRDNQTLIRGLFGPRPQVWTMFVLFYSIIGFAALVLLVTGMSFMTLGKSSMIFWGFPVLAVVFLSLYLVAYFGQKKGRGQMHILHGFLERSLSGHLMEAP